MWDFMVEVKLIIVELCHVPQKCGTTYVTINEASKFFSTMDSSDSLSPSLSITHDHTLQCILVHARTAFN